jgi:hypothetical protein
MTNDEAAWLAGLFDGRLTYKQRKGASDVLRVYVTSESVAHRLRDLAGGGIAEHPPGWRWTLYDAEEQRDLLGRVEPFMTKRQAAQSVGAECDRRARQDGRLRQNRTAR